MPARRSPTGGSSRRCWSGAGLEPGQVLYVGDDPHADVQGARNAGLHAAWVDRFGRSWPQEVAAAGLAVRDLGELADRLL